MNSSATLRSWKGLSSYAAALLHLRPSFEENFMRSIRDFASLPFVSVYGKDGSIKKRTFAEFGSDVSSARTCVASSGVVAAASENSYEFLVFAAASLLEGLTFCPLNPDEGPRRISSKLKNLDQPFRLFASRKAFSALKEALADVQLMDWGDGAAQRGRGSASPSIFVFTSGSTGYSKVVHQTEANILANVDALIELHGLKPGVVVGTPLPLFHVNALEFSFLSTLLSGASLVVFDGFDLQRSLQAIQSEQIQVLSVIPDIVRVVCDFADRIDRDQIRSLRYFLTAAAPLPPSVAKAALDRLPFRVIQGYGLSEAVNFSLTLPPDLEDAEHRHWMTAFDRPSVGCPIRGNDVEVLDPDGKALGPGIEGEIGIRGFNVMAGYLHSDNSEVFQGDYLHTGDLGVWRPGKKEERFFFLTGRKKDIIKRFGATVSLVEIDEALQGLPFEGIAVGFARELGGEDVGVVIRCDRYTSALFQQVRNFLQTELPEPLRPRAVVFVDTALKTPSGKPCRWKFQERFSALSSRAPDPGIVDLGWWSER